MKNRTHHPAPGETAREATTAGDLVQQPRIVHALSFDVEDWFHLAGLGAASDSATWAEQPSLVERYTERILEILAKHRVRATFFMLGWICQRHPHLASRIAAAGHELAVHSYWHHRCDRLTRGQLYLDLKRNIDLVEQQSGQKVLGFRAPSLSLVPEANWVFDVLLDLGLQYDSSLLLPPIPKDAYSNQNSHNAQTTRNVKNGRCNACEPVRPGMLLELPLAVQAWGPLRVPIYSGASLRWLPDWLLNRGFAQLERAQQPAALALLPRDFAADCPRAPMSAGVRLKHHTRIQRTQPRLERLISRFRFDTCAAALGLSHGQSETSACRAA